MNILRKNIRIFLFIMVLWFIAVMLYFNLVIQAIDITHPNKIDLAADYLNGFMVSVILGFFGSAIEIYSDTDKFKRLSFSLIVISKTLLLFAALIATVFIVSIIDLKGNLSGANVLSSFFGGLLDDLLKREFLNHLLYTIIIGFGINLFVQINKKMGKGVLFNLFLGKYHKPRREERVFAFLDLTSSTTIAEKLTPQLYSSFVKDFFFDIDSAIQRTNGIIFQYVGDEVVVIWEKKCLLNKNNCIDFYFLSKKRIEEKKQYYLDKYNTVPEFKVGIHYGEIIVTEVGGIKREIAYHGDTINTASRIRSMCNELNENLLISADLLSLLNSFDDNFIAESKGILSLKGKENVIGVFSVIQKEKESDSVM